MHQFHSRIQKNAALRTSALLGGLAVSTASLAGCGSDSTHEGRELYTQSRYGTVNQALVDLSTCSPKNLARNTTGAGTPSPLESDPGVGGDLWDLVDGQTQYASELRGLLFDSGATQQVTIDLGGAATLDELTVWHRSDSSQVGHNIPETVGLEYFDGSAWQAPTNVSRNLDLAYTQPASGFGSYPDTYGFDAVVASKVRWTFDGAGLNVLGANSGNTLSDAEVVAVGGQHSCAVTGSGKVYCWGQGFWGQLGNGSTADSSIPVEVSGLNDAVGIVAGDDHTCALRSTGAVRCWGSGGNGQLGNSSTASSSTPVDVSGLGNAVSLAAGDFHSCALLETGAVACWGSGGFGQLGDGTTGTSTTPVTVPGLGDAVSLSAGAVHTCAARQTGQVLCWGFGGSGRLGSGSTNNSSTPVVVSNLADAVSVGAGGGHSCAVRQSGEMVCWGANNNGQLGNLSVADSSTPVAVFELGDAVSLSVGSAHTCAVRGTGQTVCWGASGFGQTGTGSTNIVLAPTAVWGLRNAASLSAGVTHSCAVPDSGKVLCWGFGTDGQLGNGDTESVTTPVAVLDSNPIANDAVAVAAWLQHTCALRQTGEVACWGAGQSGQLGNGGTGSLNVPGAVSGLNDASSIAVGDTHSCAVRQTGGAVCWGQGSFGQLGNGGTSNSSLPVSVSGLSDAVSVAAGGGFSCALRATGGVDCWGFGAQGQLGNGATSDSNIPVAVSGLGDATSISVGGAHSCALRQTGEVVCWGFGGSGRLGSGGGSSSVPVAVSGINDAVSVSAGGLHSCAARQSGEVLCWGNNSSGQLGDGGTVGSDLPVVVLGIADAVSVSAGGDHTCVLRQTGEVSCWGLGQSGRLGNGGTANSSVPVTVLGLDDAVGISTGRVHACAVRQTGDVTCWGEGLNGQLGNGSNFNFSVPVAVFNFEGAPPVVSPWQTWLYQVSVNGCPEPPALESVGPTPVNPGQSLTTDNEGDGATLADPIETTVTTPTAGDVAITEQVLSGPSPDGFILFGENDDQRLQVDIDAPSASFLDDPLVLVFVIDSSLLPEGADENDVEVWRNDSLVGTCLAPPSAIPNPCVLSRALSGDDVVITVVTTEASIWTFGVAVQSDRDGDGTLDGYDGCPDDAGKVEPGVCGCQVPDADSDGDGTEDCNDPCPTDPDDACGGMGDADGDGVEDADDECAGTPLGEMVAADGCSIDQLCPCSGPRGIEGEWRNHGQYVACVTHAATAFRQAGLLSNREAAGLAREAARSACGHAGQHFTLLGLRLELPLSTGQRTCRTN